MKIKCSQVTCFAESTHRFTWPGSPEQPSCYEHAMTAQRIAEAMSFRLEVLAGAQAAGPTWLPPCVTSSFANRRCSAPSAATSPACVPTSAATTAGTAGSHGPSKA